MLKLAFCLRRLPHLSRGEFQAYWRDHHAPLVARYAAALGIVRYVQLHTLEDPLNAAFQAAVGTPEGLQAGEALLADERRFIDHARSPLFLAEEHGVIQNSG
jgi:hypothetical protein